MIFKTQKASFEAGLGEANLIKESMRRIFIDTSDAFHSTIDDVGHYVSDLSAAQGLAARILANLAADAPATDEAKAFRAVIRDGAGRSLLQARLLLDGTVSPVSDVGSPV